MTDDDHTHGRGEGSVRKLGLVAVINLIGFGIELVGGLAFGSVALLGDAFHMLFDALAYVLALGAALVARRAEPTGQWSYGLQRVEPFAAFLNGVLLVPMVVYLVYESYQRYLSPVTINTDMTILLAAGGLLVNFGSVYVLQGGEMNLNERGAYYHLIGDTGASIAVIVSMLVIKFTGLTIVDPITAVVIAGLIIWSAVKILRESTAIFFQKSPVSIEEVREVIQTIDGVDRVEDVHIWSLSSVLLVATVHLLDTAETVEERDQIKEQVSNRLHEEFEIDHVTVDAISTGREYARRAAHGTE